MSDDLSKGQILDVKKEIETALGKMTFSDKQTDKLAEIIKNTLKAELSADRAKITGLRQSMFYMKWVLSLQLGGVGYLMIGMFK